MKTSRIALLAAVLSATAFAAQADEADASQYVQSFQGTATRAQVQAELAAYRQAGVNPHSISYNPLKTFRSERSRADVRAEFVANREAVAALTAEDSGSAYFAANQATTVTGTQLAGTPSNAQ